VDTYAADTCVPLVEQSNYHTSGPFKYKNHSLSFLKINYTPT
jgi:hypothetical protein